MIKLIATDLDGTLLNDDKNLPEDFYDIFHKLCEKGIHFAVASGRSYSGVEHIFKDCHEDIFFVCDNGAFTVENGEIIDVCVIQPSIVQQFLDFAYQLGDVDIMMCGKNGTYYSNGSPAFLEKMENHYAPTTFVDNLYAVQDDIFKISLCDFGDIAQHSYLPAKQHFQNHLTVHMSAKIWVDAMDKSVDKGVGVQRIQEKLGITKEETMAFGDYYNDIPLLETAKYSFVMENADEEMKKNAAYIAQSCNKGGVTKAILQFALNK